MDNALRPLELVNDSFAAGGVDGLAADSAAPPLGLDLSVRSERRDFRAEVISADQLPDAAVESADTLIEAQWAILMMRDLIAAWRALQGELDPRVHQWECPLWDHRTDALDTPPWEPDGAAWLLGGVLSEGLTPFSPYVRTFAPESKPAPLFAGETSTWNVCCLELFNHVVERASYKVCANETCGRLFVRQRGRAEHGQYRMTGVKYCSSDCARAQAQRAYRRRRRPSQDGSL